MKGALTYKDLDRLKRKAMVLDTVRRVLGDLVPARPGDANLLGLQELVEQAYAPVNEALPLTNGVH